MAKKGQRFQRYDLAFKLKVIDDYRRGQSAGDLSKLHGIQKGTIFTWDYIAKCEGTLGIAKKGCPKKMKDQDYQERYEILKKFQDFLVKQEQKKK